MMNRHATGLPTYIPSIKDEWIDYNGHLRDAFYGLLASYAIDDIMDFLGLDAVYRAHTRCTLYTLELHITYLHEIKLSDNIAIESIIFDCDDKRMHLGSRFYCDRLPDPAATADFMLLHVKQDVNPKSERFPPQVALTLKELQRASATYAEWKPPSSSIGIRRR